MSKRERSARKSQPLRNLFGASVEAQGGPAAWFPYDLDLKPVHSMADAGPQRFGPGFLGSESGGKAFCRLAFPLAISLLRGRVNTVQEARAEAIHRPLDALDLNHVDPGANDHVDYKATTFASETGLLLPNPPVSIRASRRFTPLQTALSSVRTDMTSVRTAMLEKDTEFQVGIPWAIHLQAIALEEPDRLIHTLTGAIISCGGWVLSRGSGDTGAVSLLFEFERQACVDIYSGLVEAGLELSRTGHLQFTELCQCTRITKSNCGAAIASIDLEIQTYPLDNASQSSFLPPA